MTASPQNLPNSNWKEGQIYNTDLTTSSVLALKSNGNRKGIQISNYHASNTIYIRFGSAAAANTGIPIYATQTLLLDEKWSAEDVYAIGLVHQQLVGLWSMCNGNNN